MPRPRAFPSGRTSRSSSGTQTTNPTGDTGWQTHAADLSSFAGSTVRLLFVENVPQVGTGPAQFEIDAVSLLAETSTGVSEDMYAAVGRGSPVNAGAVLLIDQTNGAGTLVGDPVTPGGLTGLDFTSDGTLWGSSIDGPLGSRVSNLVRINPDTGALISSVPIRDGATAISIGDLAIQPGTNAIFGIQSNADPTGPAGDLYRIDPVTGAATRLGATGLGRGGGLAFAPDGTLYLVSFGLFTLNPANGAILTSRPLTFDDLDGLGIRPSDGTLCATRVGASPAADEIYTVNPVTGVSTLIGHTGAGNASDLAFRPGTLPPPPPSGPDIDEYTLDLEAGQTIDVAMSFLGEGATTQELITNGNFETGNFDGWVRTNNGPGSWVINNGAVDPEGPGTPRPPIAGNFDALARETGASTMTLVEPITVPSGITSAVLRAFGKNEFLSARQQLSCPSELPSPAEGPP